MSLIKILPEYVEKFSLTLHPEVRYTSSSFQGGTAYPTGAMPVAVRPSKCLKNLTDPSQMGQNSYDPNSPGVVGFNTGDFSMVANLNEVRKKVKEIMAVSGSSADVSLILGNYMELVNSSSEVSRNKKKLQIVRFDPPFSFTLNSSVKNCVRSVLMPFYSSYYDMCQFSYTNYNTLNFFTGSLVPSTSSIIYPNFQLGDSPRPYSPTGSFSFDFYINPRYANDSGAEFKAGTIMHISSTFALSLVSGTLRDGNGLVDGYRMLLQLSHSADISPSTVDISKKNNTRVYPRDLIFTSKDNSLRKNHWHHVCVRWGGDTVNDGTGSIVIDDNSYNFNVPSASILPPSHVSTNALFIGNYYEAPVSSDEGDFFNRNAGINEGVYPYEYGRVSGDPDVFLFNHPLNAEVHDLKIFDDHITDKKIKYNEKSGQRNFGSEMNQDRLMFYVPPLFTKSSKTRESLITPFQTERKWTQNPFNTTFSFGVGGYLINLQNFTREFRRGYYPRLFSLTASTIDTTVLDVTANGYIFASGSTRKANLTILPNDNGRFRPDYELLRSGTINTDMSIFKNAYGGIDLSLINIDQMITTASAYPGLSTVSTSGLEAAASGGTNDLPDDTSSESIAAQVAGVTPDSMGGSSTSTGPVLTIYQRTRDPSSNEISIFDISNLYYGNRILPGSLYITDPDVTGSGEKVKITVRDNEKGGLYRADALTEHPKWANVGTVLYNEGVAVIKSPHIAYFGKNRFEMSFKGDQNIHVLTVNIPAGVGLFNSSSNPQYKVLSASLNANDEESRFVYVSGLNLHDDNLNIIMRGNLAQPVLKRQEDEFLIRFKMDF
tara:strand:+ start:13073 stop:15559 length:2487 start_codon:yes stop_codon:yes gene_type:complete